MRGGNQQWKSRPCWALIATFPPFSSVGLVIHNPHARREHKGHHRVLPVSEKCKSKANGVRRGDDSPHSPSFLAWEPWAINPTKQKGGETIVGVQRGHKSNDENDIGWWCMVETMVDLAKTGVKQPFHIWPRALHQNFSKIKMFYENSKNYNFKKIYP